MIMGAYNFDSIEDLVNQAHQELEEMHGPLLSPEQYEKVYGKAGMEI